MLQLILMIVGIFVAARRPRLRRLTQEDYPDVDSEKFEEWKVAQLKATDTFLWATWGAFFITMFLAFALSGADLTWQAAIAFQVIAFLGFIVGIIVAAAHSKEARGLRDAAGIEWPRRTSQDLVEAPKG